MSRQPRQQRLVMAVRGAAGVGKSHFARSLADAGLGRLCLFDMERKSRLLRGVGTIFDGLEIEQPNELPEFIDWALSGEGRQQQYGCFALDSWAAYFGAKHSETIAAVRARTGDPLAQPSAEELGADQMLFQGVLRRLCMESGRSVVIVDQIPAKGKEAKEDCTKLIYIEDCGDLDLALGREKQIKAGSRRKKIELIEERNPDWRDLSYEVGE